QAIPFSAYLFSLFIALICFLLLSKITNRMAFFMLMAPLLFVLNLVLKFEFFFSFVIAIMFVWRFMALYREMYLEGEMNIFQITILIVLIEVMIFKDPYLIGILLIQLFILTMGFFLANYIQNKQAAKRQMLPFILKVMLSFTGLLAILWLIGGSLFRSAWDYFLMPVWHLATNIFISIFVGLM